MTTKSATIPGNRRRKGKVSPLASKKGNVMEEVDRAQIISDEWRVIEQNGVLVGPFQSVIGQ